MRSFTHPVVSCLCPIISAYRTISSYHPGVSHLCPSIPDYISASPPSSRSYRVTLSPCILLLFASYDSSAKVSRSCFSIASWCHQFFLLCPPPSYPFSPKHTSNIGRHSPTASRLPVVFLYWSFPNVLPLLPPLLPLRASPISCLLSLELASP